MPIYGIWCVNRYATQYWYSNNTGEVFRTPHHCVAKAMLFNVLVDKVVTEAGIKRMDVWAEEWKVEDSNVISE